jgi:DNA polymerase-3 subunit epsilon
MIGIMSDGLFDISGGLPRADTPEPPPARSEQIAAIRQGLDDAGINTQLDRQAFIEDVILMKVCSLRDLTALQARRVIDRLKIDRGRSTSAGGSLWDNRDEDTWIDRL